MDTKNYIEEGKTILQEEFNFVPEQSKIIYCDPALWNNLIRRRDASIKSFFQPRTLTAYINKNPESGLLPMAIHEYFGHGSYCEHARNGIRIAKFEQELSELEKKLVGKKLPENLVIKIIKGERNELVKSKDPKFDYVFYANNRLLQKYLSLKNNYDSFFQENLLTYEGFAVWLEEFMLNKLKKEGIWNLRKSEMKNRNGSKRNRPVFLLS